MAQKKKPAQNKVLRRARQNAKLLAGKKAKRKTEKSEEQIRRINIRVVGIGGGGNSIVSEIAPRMQGIDFIAANTDSQALSKLEKKMRCFQFGQAITAGLGTGMNSELGKIAAQKEKERIKKLLRKGDFCVFVACLGGGTASGATPVFAKASKRLGNINFGIFTLPFKFEGEKKALIAKESLRKLSPFLHAFSVIPNERIFTIVDKKTPLKAALSAINEKLTENLAGLIEMIKKPGLINIDFADLKTILRTKKKLAFLNTVELRTGQEEKGIEELILSPLYPYSIKGARGVLFNIVGGRSLGLGEVSRISKGLQNLVSKEAKIIFGVTQKKSYKSKIGVTLLAVGCQTKKGALFPGVSVKPKKRKKAQKKLVKKPKEQEPEPVKIKPKPKKVKKEIRIRRNALQIKRELEQEEKERLAQEKIWEVPAFLRQKKKT